MADEDVVEIMRSGDWFTDEVEVCFYECPCGFARVPYISLDAYDNDPLDADVLSARFCPGCGKRIIWIEMETP